MRREQADPSLDLEARGTARLGDRRHGFETRSALGTRDGEVLHLVGAVHIGPEDAALPNDQATSLLATPVKSCDISL